MNKEEFKKITEYLDNKIILHQAIGEPINKDLDISIKLTLAYEELQRVVDEIDNIIKKYAYIETEKIYIPLGGSFLRKIHELIEKVGDN